MIKLKEEFEADYKRSGEQRNQVHDGVRPDSDMPFETYEAFITVSTALSRVRHDEEMLERALTHLETQTGIDYTG